jgi:hypothetical protein
MGDMRNVYNILIRKPEGRRLHGRTSIKMNVERNRIGWCGVDS